MKRSPLHGGGRNHDDDDDDFDKPSPSSGASFVTMDDAGGGGGGVTPNSGNGGDLDHGIGVFRQSSASSAGSIQLQRPPSQPRSLPRPPPSQQTGVTVVPLGRTYRTEEALKALAEWRAERTMPRDHAPVHRFERCVCVCMTEEGELQKFMARTSLPLTRQTHTRRHTDGFAGFVERLCKVSPVLHESHIARLGPVIQVCVCVCVGAAPPKNKKYPLLTFRAQFIWA